MQIMNTMNMNNIYKSYRYIAKTSSEPGVLFCNAFRQWSWSMAMPFRSLQLTRATRTSEMTKDYHSHHAYNTTPVHIRVAD